MSTKGQLPESPAPKPQHFGERLPDLPAEKAKKLPTGAARRIAIKGAKEVGTLVWETIKQGGLPPIGRLLSFGWRAYGIYKESKAEALAELRDTYLTGRNIWATSIVSGVQAKGHDVSGDTDAKQDISDFLGPTPQAAGATSAPLAVFGADPEQERLQAVIANLQKMEDEVKLFLKRVEGKPPKTDGEAQTELDRMIDMLKRNKDDLSTQAAGMPGEPGAAEEASGDPNEFNPPFTPEQENAEVGYLNQYLDITGRTLEGARGLPPNTPTKIRGRMVTYFPPKSTKVPEDGLYFRTRKNEDDWRDPMYQESVRIVTPAGTKLTVVRYPSGYMLLCANGEEIFMIHRSDVGDRNELSWNRELYTVGLGLAEKGFGDIGSFETTYQSHKKDRVDELKASGKLYYY